MHRKLVDAAKVFSFEIPSWLADDVAVGTIAGVTIHAGEVRRLREALMLESSDDEIILDFTRRGDRIGAIKYRREKTGESLRDAKNYCDELGIQHRILVRYNSTVDYPGDIQGR